MNELPFDLGDIATTHTTWFTLSNRCNIHCKYCFNYLEDNTQDMSPELAVQLLEYMLNARIQYKVDHIPFRIIFFGGEPTLNPTALFAMLDYIGTRPETIHLHIMTNGIMNKKMLRRLMQEKMLFQISFDGFAGNLRLSKEGDDNVMYHTADTIRSVIAAGLPVHMRTTIHQANVKSMTEVVHFAAKEQLTSLAFAPICQFGEVCKNNILQPDVDEFVTNLNVCIKLAKELNLKLNVHESMYLHDHNKNATIPFVWLPDGSLAVTITYASAQLPGAESIIIGRYVIDQKAMQFDDHKIQQMKVNFLKNRALECLDCEILLLCKGINNFSAYVADTYSQQREKYFCDISRKMLRHINN
jgi:sulfatase maturation enzyme AslB (radical SAM superfamily)